MNTLLLKSTFKFALFLDFLCPYQLNRDLTVIKIVFPWTKFFYTTT